MRPGGQPNLNQLMKQAQKMQQQLAAAQAATAHGVAVSFDGNWRGKLWERWDADPRTILSAIVAHADLMFGNHRDIALLLVSSAPLAEIERFRQRMGWRLPWVSSQGSDFNRDFQVSFTAEELARDEVFYNYGWSSFPLTEAPGISVFSRNDSGQLFHSYSTYGRGLEVMMGAYGLMDLTPQGRGEEELDFRMAWVRHHDRYEDAPAAACCSSTAPA